MKLTGLLRKRWALTACLVCFVLAGGFMYLGTAVWTGNVIEHDADPSQRVIENSPVYDYETLDTETQNVLEPALDSRETKISSQTAESLPFGEKQTVIVTKTGEIHSVRVMPTPRRANAQGVALLAGMSAIIVGMFAWYRDVDESNNSSFNVREYADEASENTRFGVVKSEEGEWTYYPAGEVPENQASD